MMNTNTMSTTMNTMTKNVVDINDGANLYDGATCKCKIKAKILIFFSWINCKEVLEEWAGLPSPGWRGETP